MLPVDVKNSVPAEMDLEPPPFTTRCNRRESVIVREKLCGSIADGASVVILPSLTCVVVSVVENSDFVVLRVPAVRHAVTLVSDSVTLAVPLLDECDPERVPCLQHPDGESLCDFFVSVMRRVVECSSSVRDRVFDRTLEVSALVELAAAAESESDRRPLINPSVLETFSEAVRVIAFVTLTVRLLFDPVAEGSNEVL